MSDRDKTNLEKMLQDPAHEALNVSLEPIIETDEDGKITYFMPTTSTKWGLIFYLQNLMIRQRLYLMDEILEKEKGKKE